MTEKTQSNMGLRRGIALLKIMARSPEGCGFRELQQHMDGLPAATLSRILKVMIDEQLIIKDKETGAYLPGELAFGLSRRFLGQATPAELLRPVLDGLAAVTGHSAAFARLEHDGFTYRAVVEADESFHYMPVGRLNTNTVTNGFGLVCLAFAPAEIQDRFIRERHDMLKSREKVAAYREQLRTVRTEGAYVDITKTNMTRFVAAVFHGQGGNPVGAMGVTVPGAVTDDRGRTRYLDAVIRAAEQATGILG